MTRSELLKVEGLTLNVVGTSHTVVKNVSFSVFPGETVGIVGESGSGKTLVAKSIMGLEPPAIQRRSGSIRFEREDITRLSPLELRRLRGARMGMVFQEPMTSLNPSMKIGQQMEEGLALHRKDLSKEQRRDLVLDMLRRVGIREPQKAVTAYPHEFSGGMRQRIMLASVMLLKPALLVADEPTTALDAVVQRDVLDLMTSLTRAHGTAVLMISHDLAMVARYTDRIIVMCKGEIVEEGKTQDLLDRPQHQYTRKLLATMPRRLPKREISVSSPPVVEVRDLVIEYGGSRSLFRAGDVKQVLHSVSLSVRPREVVALVGGSGSGKTTLGRTIAGLIEPSSGEIRFSGETVRRDSPNWIQYRLNCQMVFQDPYSSLDPRMRIAEIVGEALRLMPDMSHEERQARVQEILEEVGLGGNFAQRYPHELSGGQRQRVAIARALVRRPSFVVADEPVSALDVTVRAQVLDLFAQMQDRYGFSCLFISHDLGVVEQIADRVVVMKDGRIVEEGDRDTIFDHPQHPYTIELLSAVPSLETNDHGGVQLKWRYAEPAAPAERPHATV
jgi:ATPase components of various ABC-type transport systems, contain duplicated ATPase